MSVSKKRHLSSTHQRHRERERLEIKERAVYRQHRFNHALNDLCEAEGTVALHDAVHRVQKIAPDKKQLFSSFFHATPADLVAHRRGWKSVTNNLEDDESEVWIYTPTIPKDWDESSIDQPTALAWDGYFYTLSPAVRDGVRVSEVVFHDNPFRLVREISMIESW